MPSCQERRRDNLNKVRSRLGSLSKGVRAKLPPSVQKILDEDMPALIAVVETGAALVPRQPSELKLGQWLVDGWYEFQGALDAVGAAPEGKPDV